MKKLILLLTVLSVILVFSYVSSSGKDDLQFKKQPEIQQIKPKKPVKIKLKRSAEGKYSWELDGDDADEIAKVDKRLRKLLKIE